MKTFSTFRFGIWRHILPTLLAGLALASNAIAQPGNSERTKELTAVLRSQAPLFDKARACQQLGEIGGKEAVPALADLLSDEHLAAYARSGLEGIPDPSAAAALREALGNVKGRLLAGVINSLGVLRDPLAVAPLRPLAEEAQSGVAKEALLALGRIATDESISIIRKALASGPEALRGDAAAACLLAAERQLVGGHPETAEMLNDAVRTANVAVVYRSAAIRGAILSRRANRVEFLMEQLRSEDPVARSAALLTIREIPLPEVAAALNTEVEKAEPQLKLQLINALGDCHDEQSLRLLEVKADGDDPELRKAALRVLARVGGPAQAGVLLRILAAHRSESESELAEGGLERLEGSDIDELVLQSLRAATETPARVQLIGLLEARGATNAVVELLAQAAGPDPAVSAAAFGALGALAGAGQVPALIKLTKDCKSNPARDAAEKAICRVAGSGGDIAVASEAVLAELPRSDNPVEKNVWVRILVFLGYAKALPSLEAATRDSDEAVAANAIESLGRWPDTAPVDALLAVIETGANSTLRQRAFTSLVGLAVVAADEHQRSEAVIVGWLARAVPAAHSVGERRQIISLLARLKRPESFRLLTPWLEEPDLQAEADVALVQIAPALVNCQESAAVKGALERVAATAKNADIRSQAAKLAQSFGGKAP